MHAVLTLNERKKLKERLITYWKSKTTRPDVHGMTVSIIMGYVEKYGESVVFSWIDEAFNKYPTNDRSMGKFISKNRWNHILSEETF
jgi:hypothetical protein